jgi:hypothetical protein
MQFNALFDKGRRDALRGAIASGDFGKVLRKQAEPSDTFNMTIKSISVFIPESSGVPMEEAIRRADEAGVVIASNKKIDSLIIRHGWEMIKGAFPCWTGTMTGYVPPGRTFREAGEWNDALKSHAIVYVDEKTKIRYLFPIPEEHLDKKDSILVTEHPDFKLETRGNDRIVRAARTGLIERFPAQNGWYQADSQFGIPFGDAHAPDVDSFARHLYRKTKRVGLVARGDDGYVDYSGRRVVYLFYRPSSGLGVAVDSHGAKD